LIYCRWRRRLSKYPPAAPPAQMPSVPACAGQAKTFSVPYRVCVASKPLGRQEEG
jgi:hypothetical protein